MVHRVGMKLALLLIVISCQLASSELVTTSSGSLSVRSPFRRQPSAELVFSEAKAGSDRLCGLSKAHENLMRLRGGSSVSEARLKAQAQALAAVKAKASQLSGKPAPAPPAAAPAATPAPAPAPKAAPAQQQSTPQPHIPAQTKPVENNGAGKTTPLEVKAAPTAPASVGAAPASDSAAKPRSPIPVVQPPADTMEIPGGEEPVQAIAGAGSVKKVTDIAQKNRLLVMQCKALRARATDPKMKKKLDARIFELEAAWDNYVKVDTSTTQHSLFAPRPKMINRTPSQLDLAQHLERTRRSRIPVTFTVSCPFTAVGERVLLLGDAEELGSWNPLAAVPLDTTNVTYPLWHATVDMPAGAIVEYKYAIGTPGVFREQYDVVEWEGYMGNRGFKVPRKAHHIHEEFEQGVNSGQQVDYDIPEYLTMHRIGGSECFLDPEYASIY